MVFQGSNSHIFLLLGFVNFSSLPRRWRHKSVIAVVSYKVAEMSVGVGNNIEPPLQVLWIWVPLNCAPDRREGRLYFGDGGWLGYERKQILSMGNLSSGEQRILLLFRAHQGSVSGILLRDVHQDLSRGAHFRISLGSIGIVKLIGKI